MRHTLFAFAFLLISGSAFSQKGFNGWFHFGLKGGLGTSNMFHSNMISDKNTTMKMGNMAYSAGYEVGATLANKVEITFESNQHNISQTYNFVTDNFDYTQPFNISYIENIGLVRILTANGYFEIGYGKSNFESIKDITPVFKSNSNGLTIASEPTIFEQSYGNILTGFGAVLLQQGLFEIDLGLRFNYSLGSITRENTLTLTDVNMLTPDNIDPVKTSAFSAILQLEVKYFFGFFGKGICGRRGVMFFKKPKGFSIQ